MSSWPSAAALVAFAGLALALGVPAGAHAEAEPISIELSAPANCPSAQEVLRRVRKLTGVGAPAGTPLRAAATITQTNGGQLHLRLVVHSGDLTGERSIEAKTCEALANAIAIHLALLVKQGEPIDERDLAQVGAVDAAVKSAQPNSNGSAEPVAAPKSVAANRARDSGRDTTPVHRVDPTAARSWRAVLQVPLASMQLGPLPRPSFGVSLAAGVLWERWRLLAEGHAWLKQTLLSQEQLGVGADVDHIGVGLRTCRSMSREPFEVAPCLYLSVEHIGAHGTGPHVASRTATTTWLAAGLGAQAGIELVPWLRLILSVGAQLETARPQISIDGVGRVGRLGPAAITVSTGLEWNL